MVTKLSENSKGYADKSVKVKPTTKETLEKIGKGKSIDETINILFGAYYDLKKIQSRLKTLEDEVIALRSQRPQPQAQPATSIEASTTDSPKETEKPAEVLTTQVESQPCPYYSFNHTQSLVHCSKDFDTKGMIHRVTQEVCDMCWERIQSKKDQAAQDETIAEQYPCLCRFDHDNEWLCALNSPTVRRLEYGLKTCQACPDRLTEEKRKQLETQGEFTETMRYITCGAKQKEDPKAGLLIWDSKNPNCPHKGYAVPIQACFNAKCPYAKLVQVIPKK